MNEEDRTNTLRWLHENANPIIGLWAAERLGAPKEEVGRLRAAMLAHPAVDYWINCLLGKRRAPNDTQQL